MAEQLKAWPDTNRAWLADGRRRPSLHDHIYYRNTHGALMRILTAVSRRALTSRKRRDLGHAVRLSNSPQSTRKL